MKIIYNWKVRRSGAGMTVEGHDQEGNTVKISAVAELERAAPLHNSTPTISAYAVRTNGERLALA